MSFELHHAIRAQCLRGVLKAVNDNGADQIVDLELHAGQLRCGVPVHYPFGFSAHVPLNGAVTHVFQNGGDPADLVALPPSNPSVARFGQLNEGETVLYDAAGQRLHFQNGVLLAVEVAQSLRVSVAGSPVLVVTDAGLQVTGTITATGDITAGEISLQNHTHGGVQAGGANTGKPE